MAAGSFASLRENVKYYQENNYAQLIRTIDLKNNFTNSDFVYVDEVAYDFLWRVQLKEPNIVLPNIGANIGEKYYVKPQDLPKNKNVLGPNAILLRSKCNDTHFVYFRLSTSSYDNEMKKLVGASGQPKFNKTDLKKVSLFMPSLIEQKRIAYFLALLEERIATQNKIIEDLKKLKSAIIEMEYGNMAKSISHIGDFIEQTSKRNKDSAILNVLSVSNSQGFIQQSEQFENRIVASDDTSNYKIVARNDFAFNPARINVGSIARLTTFEKGIVSPMYICFRTKDNLFPEYLDYYFESKRFFAEIQKRLEGSVRQCLSFEGLCNIPLCIPTVEIQQQIGKRLSTLAKDIKLEIDFLELLQRQKRFLLHQLFI